ncbi:MAG: type II toxin-antitoxin system HicB family antitoxin [Faecalimonas sp.]|nr:type II toxin-antitoxin system HicB family antitoxin [Faecalimonas sp.]
MKDRYVYVAVLTYEENGITIEFPDLPGCYPCAEKDDIEGALQNAKEALGLHIWGMEQDGEEIPYPTNITELSLEKGQIPALIDVFMPPVRERINSKFVKKRLNEREMQSALEEAERIAKDPSVKGYTDMDELFNDLKK